VTLPAAAWDEAGQSEDPAIALLVKLGFTFASPEALEVERDTLRDIVLEKRLRAVLSKLNPWLSDDNLHKAVRAVTNVQASTLIEANERLYGTLFAGISLDQDLGVGKKGQQVRFIDFDNPKTNEFLVTRQYRVKGSRKHVVADVVCFVNGIPLALIECKNPTIGEGWKTDALDQLERYQELSDRFADLGSPRLFHTMQLLVATCGQDAIYGTVGTPGRAYLRWKKPYPFTTAEVAKLASNTEPSSQDVALAGLCAPENLLDIARNFVVFERDVHTGRVLKKIPRYQQFAAVNEALARSRSGKRPEDRGGVVWHTQGSGKSLSMLWLAQKLRRDPRHENPTLVLVTDRRDLDNQITKTFIACGFPNPVRAESIRKLREILQGPGGSTVMTTVQKFQEIGGIAAGGKRAQKQKHPVLSDASNVFVLTDEAHRTQYGSLAANLRAALPNAVFFGFTGTPIDKQDRSTLTTFGPYIDQYTIEQAVADEATVPIFYESRLPELQIVGNSLDQLFERVFADRSPDERRAIKQKYATEQVLAEAPRRIEAVCLDILDHYGKFIGPDCFKAQVVVGSRHAAVLYREQLDALHGPLSAVVMSSAHNEEAALAKHATTDEDRKQIIENFLNKDHPLKFLIVCDMLLTGFDAPVEQVMYLDKALKEHTLLQAIARVNRIAEHKKYGLVVDYWGVSTELQEALAIFSPSDVKGALMPKHDELPRLQARHAAAMRFFGRLKDKGSLDECVAVLGAEDVRAEFNTAFRRFAESMDMMLPEPKALDYANDLGWLGKIRLAARARYRDETVDVSDCGDKVRKLIEDSVAASGVQILVKSVNIFSGEFQSKLDALKSDDAKASEMEHAVRHEIHVKLEEDPAYYQSLRERLEEIIEDRKQERIDAAKQLSLLQRLVDDVRGQSKAAEGAGLSETGYAIYGLLKGAQLNRIAEGAIDHNYERVREVAAAIESALEPHVAIVDWTKKYDVQREMRRHIKRALPIEMYGKTEQENVAEAIVDLLKVRKKR